MPWLRRFRNLWRDRSLSREFDDELRFHLDTRVERNIGRGMNEADAMREARRHMGNLTRAREEMRDVHIVTWLDGLSGDLRHGLRVFGRHPLLTGLAVLTLSLGIGANAAIFSVFEAVLLRPLPYPAADRLVLLFDRDEGDRLTTPTIPELVDVAASSRSFDGVAFFDTRDFQIAGGEEPQRAVGARIAPAFLSLLGVQPALGRVFNETDGRAGNTVILGNGLWRQNFGGDLTVIGRTLTVNGTAHEIVGVLPDTFSFGYLSPATIDLYVPYPTSPEYMLRSGQFANVRRVSAVARLAPGVAMEAASSELGAISANMAAAYPDLYKNRGPGGAGTPFGMTAQPLRESLTRNSRPVLLMLLGAVVLVLLIACVNTSQFLLAQAIEREPEVALRAALGASRGRVARQFGTEALLLVAAGGLVGIVQAAWLIGVLRGLIPRNTPVVGQIGLDGSVLTFLFCVTILTAVACVLVPALRFSQANLVSRLGGRGGGSHRSHMRHAFIAAEVAMSVVLLVSAGLLLRSLHELQRAQGGFSTDGVTILRIRGMGGGPTLGDTYARYLGQIGSVGGIQAVGAASGVLPGRPSLDFTIVGDASGTAARSRQQTSYQIVSGGYFAALGVPLEAGRLFTDDDTPGRPAVALINREMAQQYWPNQDPIGRQVRAGEGPRAATMTIVGIVGNIRAPFQNGDAPQLYVSYRQQSEPNMTIVVRTPPGTTAPIAAIKQAIWSVDSKQAVFDVSTLERQLAQSTTSQRAMATLIGGFAALALAMSISGIYTVIAYLVTRRFKEIAVRRAIGATGGHVLWSLAAPTLRWTIAGLFVGAGGAVAGTRLLRSAVSGVVPLDAALMTIVPAAYLAVVVLAIAAAARGALRIDPAAALRAE